VSVLTELIAVTDPGLRAHAVAEPGPPRFDEQVAGPERTFVLEAVYEGYLMHYGEARLFAGMEADLRLLAGDSLYALGLARLADAGDLEAVSELSDLISLSARAQADGRPDRAEALWEASEQALSGVPGPGAGAIAADWNVFLAAR
jgi:hypothetical protein